MRERSSASTSSSGSERTAALVLGTVGRPGRLAPGPLFARSLIASGLGIAFGLVLFPAEAGLVGVFLLCFAGASTVESLLERNRDEILVQELSAAAANRRLAVSLLLIFGAVFVAYVAAAQLASPSAGAQIFSSQLGTYAHLSVVTIESAGFWSLLVHNLGVALSCLLFALLYRHAGLLFVLAWNASRWGVVLSHLARLETASSSGPERLLGVLMCVLPHLVLEALAYVLVAMAGVFLSKAAVKYELSSSLLRRVVRAAVLLIAAAVLTLAVAALVESKLAPLLLSVWFSSP